MITYSWEDAFRDFGIALKHREYLLRKYIHLTTKDLKKIKIKDVNRFLLWHENEEIQNKIDLFGAGGTNLLDSKCGTSFYKKWAEKQQEEAERYDEFEDLQFEEEMKFKRKIYDLEIQRILTKPPVNK